MKVVLSPNPYRDRGLKAAQSARRILEKCGVEATMCWCASVETAPSSMPPGRPPQGTSRCWV